MAKRRSQSEHDITVEMLANALYARNHNPKMEDVAEIKADIAGFHRPVEISMPGFDEAYVPDATALGSKLLIFEVETPDSINDEHTEKQWGLFAAYAEENDAEFSVVVPPMAVLDARKRLNQLSIKATVLSVP